MPIDYSEKRDFFRMNIDCSMEYSVNGSNDKAQGTVLTLSGNGVSLRLGDYVDPGTLVHVSIAPENTVTPPLDVTVEVLRCEPGNDSQLYEVAGNITER